MYFVFQERDLNKIMICTIYIHVFNDNAANEFDINLNSVSHVTYCYMQYKKINLLKTEISIINSYYQLSNTSMEFICFATYFWALDNMNYTFNKKICMYVQKYIW